MTAKQKEYLNKLWISTLKLQGFKRHFFRYLILREGVKNNVYKDSKGLLTVGIGHLVQPGDGLKFGQLISDDRIMQIFESDFNRLKIEKFTAVTWYGIPQKIAVGSFLWTHGYGDFAGNQTQKLMQSPATTHAQLSDWVANNWDLHSPVNIARNQADLQLWSVKSEAASGLFYSSEFFSGNFYFHVVLDDSFNSKSDMKAAWAASEANIFKQ